EDAAANHLVAEFDRRRKAFLVRGAVALDDDAFQAEKDPAIDLAHIHLLTEPLEGAAREQIADPRHESAAHGGAQIFSDLARRSLRGLERDIAGKTFGDHHVHRALTDVVALHEAAIVYGLQRRLAQHAPGFLDLLLALDLLHAHIEKANRRALDVEQGVGHGRAQYREIDKLLGIGADGGAHVEHNAFAAYGRPDRCYGRALDVRHRPQAEFRHGHQSAGVAGRDAGVGIAGLDCLDRLPHRGFPALLAKRLAGLVVHAHGDVAMHEVAHLPKPGQSIEHRADSLLAAEDHKTRIWPPLGDPEKAR